MVAMRVELMAALLDDWMAAAKADARASSKAGRKAEKTAEELVALKAVNLAVHSVLGLVEPLVGLTVAELAGTMAA